MTEQIENEQVEEDEAKWKVIQVDSQVLSLFMSCPAKFNYVMNRHLVPAEGPPAGIRRGTIIHNACLEYWKIRIANIADYETAIRAAVRKAKTELEQQMDFDSDYRLDTLNNLLEFLKFIQASSWIPLAAEKHFRVKVYEDPVARLRIYLTGRIDLILRSPQISVLPVDNKTESERWFYTQMSNQFKIYCIATETNILGVQRIGFQKTVKPEEKFKMEMLPFDPDVLEEWRTVTLPHYVLRLIECYEKDFWPMNSTSCVHGHFKCEFSDGRDHKGICNVSRSVREQKLLRYFKIGEPWDPANI